MPVFESVQEWEVETHVSCPDSCSVPFTSKTMFSRFFGALTCTVQWMTFPFEGSLQLTVPTFVPGRFFFAHAVNDVFIVLSAYWTSAFG